MRMRESGVEDGEKERKRDGVGREIVRKRETERDT